MRTCSPAWSPRSSACRARGHLVDWTSKGGEPMARRKGNATSSKQAHKELRTLRERLDKLIGQAKRAEREVEVRYARQMRGLRLKRAQAKRALQKLRRRSAAA